MAISAMIFTKNHGLLLRENFPELQRSLIMKSLELVPKGIAKYNDQKKTWTFFNGSVLEFGYLESDKDCKAYQSAQYGFLGWDELTHQSEYRYRYLLSRVRTDNPKVHPLVLSCSNPGNIGHGWVKQRFRINEAKPCEVFVGDEAHEYARLFELVPAHLRENKKWIAALKKPRKRVFVPARVWDNPWLMETDPAYLLRLLELPEPDRSMLLEGNWDVFAGQVFAEWRYEKHVVEPFTIPAHWKRFRAIDPGYNAPLACLWFAMDPDGRIYIYKELYGPGMMASVSGAKILDMSTKEKIDYTVAGPDAWARRGEVGESVAETWIRLGIMLRQADKSAGSRILKKMRVHEWFADAKDGKPRLQVFSNCRNLIRTIPELIYDDNNVEDVSDKCEDHLYEAMADGLMTRPRPIVGVAEKTYLEENKDIALEAILAGEIEEEVSWVNL